MAGTPAASGQNPAAARVSPRLFALLVVVALGPIALLRAQENPEDPDEHQTKIYLPAVMQGGTRAEHAHDDEELGEQLVVRLTHRSHREMECFLSELDVLEQSCGKNFFTALVSPADYQRLVAEGRRVVVGRAFEAVLLIMPPASPGVSDFWILFLG